jgi:hypothetical protein
MTIIDIVESSRLFPWAYIDCGFRQGEGKVLAHLQKQFDEFQEEEHYSISKVLSSMQRSLREVSAGSTSSKLREHSRSAVECAQLSCTAPR